MAIENGENPSVLSPRLSPGDAAFERLQRREALKAKEAPATAGSSPEAEPAAITVHSVVPAAEAEAAATPPSVRDPVVEMKVEPISEPVKAAGDPFAGNRALEPVIDTVEGSPKLKPTGAVIKTPAIDDPAARIIAVAAALGIEATPAPPPKASPPRPAATKAGPPEAEATAERLEAALLDQLKTLEETLQTPARMPRAARLRPARAAPGAPGFIGPPRRSTFAPDPVRQRTYVDLRNPAPEPERDAADDPPWRKYLAEPRRQGSRHAVSIHTEAQRAEVRSPALVVATYDTADDAQERARGIRAMSAAAVLGLGLGLGLLVLMRPSAEPVVSSVTTLSPDDIARAAPAADPPAEAAPIAAPRVMHTAGEALATLLAEPEVTRAGAGLPAVITEPEMVSRQTDAAEPAVSPAPAAPAAAAPAAEPPIVIRPPPGEARRVARVPDFDRAETGPLAYVPTIPSYDPVRQSLLEEEAGGKSAEPGRAPVEAGATADEAPVERDIRPGRATINTFVNMRSKPDNASPVVAILADGLSVRVLSCDYWCEVEAGGKRGFVFKRFVTR